MSHHPNAWTYCLDLFFFHSCHHIIYRLLASRSTNSDQVGFWIVMFFASITETASSLTSESASRARASSALSGRDTTLPSRTAMQGFGCSSMAPPVAKLPASSTWSMLSSSPSRRRSKLPIPSSLDLSPGSLSILNIPQQVAFYTTVPKGPFSTFSHSNTRSPVEMSRPPSPSEQLLREATEG
jgi:hypothetical protein